MPLLRLTNEVILELYSFMNRNATTFYVLWHWMSCLYSRQHENNEFPTIKSIRQSVLHLSASLTSLKKLRSSSEKSSVITEFLSQPYRLPPVLVSRGKVVVSSTDDSSTLSCSSCAELKMLVKQKMYAARRNGQKRVKRRNSIRVKLKKTKRS